MKLLALYISIFTSLLLLSCKKNTQHSTTNVQIIPAWKKISLPASALTFKSLLLTSSGVYAGNYTSNAGVFFSSDNGNTWQSKNNGLPNNKYIIDMDISGSRLYAAVMSDMPGDGGVFSSSDNGENWTAVNTGLSDLSVWSLAVTDSSIFVATQTKGVFRSRDAGNSWAPVTTNVNQSIIYKLAVIGKTIFAGTGDGKIIASYDDGVHWTLLSTISNVTINDFATIGNDIYVATLGKGIYKSNDGGFNWIAVNSGLNNLRAESLTADGLNLYVGTFGSGVFKSADKGAQWVSMGLDPFKDQEIPALALKGNALFAATANGLWIYQ